MNLVFIRHGQSLWNLENKFTGWVDIDLSERGEVEAKSAGVTLIDNNFYFMYLQEDHMKERLWDPLLSVNNHQLVV